MDKRLYYYATTQDACLEAIAFGVVRAPVHGALVLSDTVAGILMLKALNQEENDLAIIPVEMEEDLVTLIATYSPFFGGDAHLYAVESDLCLEPERLMFLKGAGSPWIGVLL